LPDMSTARNNRLLVIGDSHAPISYGGVAGAEIYWLGAVTMHRVARDGLTRLLIEKRRWVRWSSVELAVLSFGEIDCRAHVQKIAAASNRTAFEVVDDLASRFLSSISHHPHKAKLAVSCVVPPVVGPDEQGAVVEQVAIRRRLNNRLAHGCRRAGLGFVDYYDVYALPDGSMNPALSDGNVHVNYYRSQPVADALAKVVGRPIPWQRPDRGFGERANETRLLGRLRTLLSRPRRGDAAADRG
jgi:hypothetical protein